jgi:hypothetical protein
LRILTAVLVLSLGSSSARATAGSASVISAAATSSAAQAAPVNCLLTPGCTGAWWPGSADSGASEGVYVQFENPVEVDSVELTTNVKDANAPFTLSINGSVAARPSVKPPSETGKYAVRYAVPGNRVKSIFFRLGVQKGGWRGFQLYSIRFYSQGKAVDLTLPVLVPASVTATSVLEPKVAYQPANLFDSRYDFAWSINGQTSKGKGESVEVKFSRPQNLAGMIVWNGYQRSEVHFKANGRVAKVAVSDGTTSSTLPLADKMGSQRIVFTRPLKNVSSLKLTIEEIIPGAKYPDVLISELRLIDDQNRILIPQVQGITPESSPLIEPLLDRSLSSVVCSSSFTPGNFQRSLRLRKNGSFVIYGKAHDEEENKKTDQVLEGNWELRGTGIRIFGKRYSDTIVRNEYSQAARRAPPSIFQSDLKIAKFGDLAPAEQQQLAALIWTKIASKADWEEANGAQVEIQGIGRVTLAHGADEKALLADLVKALRSVNPWTVSSPIVADAFMFSDDVGACATTF